MVASRTCSPSIVRGIIARSCAFTCPNGIRESIANDIATTTARIGLPGLLWLAWLSANSARRTSAYCRDKESLQLFRAGVSVSSDWSPIAAMICAIR